MGNDLDFSTRVKLNNGVEMPVLGLGTWEMHGKNAQKSILYALEIGYRLIDTAAIYRNEKDVGKAIRKSGIPRDEIFITTKRWNADHGYKSAIAACERSLRRLGTSYIDLYLIHWPVEGLRNRTWEAMEALLNKGRCRAIGVSNYMVRHLKEVLDFSSTIPAVNQVEFSPYLYQKGLLDFCQAHGVQLEAYSPLTRAAKLDDPGLISIAEKYSKSTAQILIRWVLQKNIVTIPKSSKEEHTRDNTGVFDFVISPEDSQAMDSLDENLRTWWDPSEVE